MTWEEKRKRWLIEARLRVVRREHLTLLKQVPANDREQTRFSSRTGGPSLDQVLGTPLLLGSGQAGRLYVETSRASRKAYVTQLFTHFGSVLPFRTWRSSAYETAMARHDAALVEAST